MKAYFRDASIRTPVRDAKGRELVAVFGEDHKAEEVDGQLQIYREADESETSTTMDAARLQRVNEAARKKVTPRRRGRSPSEFRVG